MRTTTRLSLAAAAVFALAALPLRADDFHWQGKVAAGRAVEIKGINGSIDARASDGTEVEVTARKIGHGRASELDEVKVELVEHEGGVTICAVYPSRWSSKPNKCEPGDGSGSNSRSEVDV